MEIFLFFKFVIFVIFSSYSIILSMVAICKGIDSVLGTCGKYVLTSSNSGMLDSLRLFLEPLFESDIICSHEVLVGCTVQVGDSLKSKKKKIKE